MFLNNVNIFLCRHLFLFATLLLLLAIIISNMECRRMIDKECLQCDKNESFSFFWKIERSKPSPPSYFFGTIHAPYTKVWNYVPSKAKSAFRHSQHIIFELDLMNAETLLSLTQCQLLPPGIRLSDIIPIDLYHRLQRHLRYVKFKMSHWITQEQKSRGLNSNTLYTAITLNWERKRPIWVMIMLNSLTENDIKSKGITVLDSFFYQKAKKLKKSIGSVENAKEQCKTLNYLNTTQVLYALNQTLLQHEHIRRGYLRSNHTTDDMIRHYNCGNLNEALFNEDSANIPILKNRSSSTLSSSISSGNNDEDDDNESFSKNIENYFRFEIILKRNKRMSQRVLELLKSNPKESFFFVFGAGHFLGNDSIIELMKDHNGLEIVHINDDRQQKQSLICDPTITTTKTTTSISSNVESSSGRRTKFMNNGAHVINQHDQQQQSEETLIYPISSESIHRLPSSWFHHYHHPPLSKTTNWKSIDPIRSSYLPATNVLFKDSNQKIQWPMMNMVSSSSSSNINWNKDSNQYPASYNTHNDNNNNQAMLMTMMMMRQSNNQLHPQQQHSFGDIRYPIAASAAIPKTNNNDLSSLFYNNNNIHHQWPNHNQNQTNMMMDIILPSTRHRFDHHHPHHHHHRTRSNNDYQYHQLINNKLINTKLFAGLVESNLGQVDIRPASSSYSITNISYNGCRCCILIIFSYHPIIFITIFISIRALSII
ncbi:metalloprotease tiki1-like isoform x1 [Dermatophagoides farinae]|nr:metalloprotease tiki1-like isoform x1 [Dermatophagoides farinae]